MSASEECLRGSATTNGKLADEQSTYKTTVFIGVHWVHV